MLTDIDAHPGPSSAFTRIPQRSVSAEAIGQIKQLVASGVLKPGQRLPSERELAEQLGVSRPTMRETMSALEAMGVIRVRHGSGTYVTDLSAEVLASPFTFLLDLNQDALRDLFRVRVLLEAGAAEEAAKHISPEGIAALGASLDQMSAATNADELLVPDLEFHQVIHRASGNSLLLSLMDSLRVLIRRSLTDSAELEFARVAAVDEHQQVLEALRTRNGQRASEAMRRHVENAHKRAQAVDGRNAPRRQSAGEQDRQGPETVRKGVGS